ncbi:type II toxin-antitoxin system RelE/ParE family toxin [Salmonella enterica subsp. enterica serovar Typhi]|nr:type II toxin-antitoxin system RelE/ParE family toxin [Salmonella enterica subsp. enterica serovar Typhi]EBW1603886.1 type II toxin-antitoxin system RelE/ParE family toxin [Salmonella enterica subsp. enterica serovar Kottbus]ECI7719556.1 type II toxin-antitoxin system RelE/ParE family toxin [Salmonella enterica subsp. enterica]
MPDRIFKTAWFAKAARKIRLSDVELVRAAREAEQGRADDLGGGVFKKRLGDNNYRSILLAKSGDFWVYVYLFAKQDRANIDDDELKAFRELAALYRRKSEQDLQTELAAGVLKEIGNVDQAQVQE